MAHTPRIAVCAGSFDPLTNGHIDLISRAARLFDGVVVGVLANPAKQSWFSIADRVAMTREVITSLPGMTHVQVDTFNGLLVDFVRQKHASAIVRGLRTSTEFVDESQRAVMNRHLSERCETLFLVASPDVAHISSRLVKEVAAAGGPLDGLVPPAVLKRIARLASGKQDLVV
jgi:pantetheine-phosphate adenylyltransferase